MMLPVRRRAMSVPTQQISHQAPQRPTSSMNCHTVTDHRINAAKAVSTFLRVSVSGWSPILSCTRWRSAVSRLSSVNASAHSASLGVTSAVRREPSSARCCSRQ